MKNKKTASCSWRKEEGYFGDFGPGLYPLSCPNCAGIGFEGIVSKDVLEYVKNMRNEVYEVIKTKTKRLEVTSESFKMGIMSELAETQFEREQYKTKRNELLRKLGTFSDDYITEKKDCIKKAWKKVAEVVEPENRDIVEKNGKNVVGKTYRDNAIMELKKSSITAVLESRKSSSFAA